MSDSLSATHGADHRRTTATRSRPTSPVPTAMARAAASSSSTTCPATTGRPRRSPAGSPSIGYDAICPNLYCARGAGRGARRRRGRRPAPTAACPDERLVGDVAGARGVPACAADVERQGRRDRLLLRRPADRPRGVQSRPRRGRRLLRRVRHRHTAGRASRCRSPTWSTSCPACGAPLLGLFGNDDTVPEPRAGRRAGRDPRPTTARRYEFHTLRRRRPRASSPSTARPTGSPPPTTAGSGSRPSTATHLGGLSRCAPTRP